MKDMLFVILAIVSVALAVLSWRQYTGSANAMFLIAFIVLILATIAFGALFLSGRVNKNSDIHITE